MAVPSVDIRVASHAGTRPPCSGRSAVPERFIATLSLMLGVTGRTGGMGRIGRTDEHERARVGLCGDCLHARKIESSRGSIFYLCLRAEHDPAYKKYPALPVRSCAGHELKRTSTS